MSVLKGPRMVESHTEKDGLIEIKVFHFQTFLSYIGCVTKEND